MNINEYQYLSNYEDIVHIYNRFKKARVFMEKNNNNNIMHNINKFISLFKKDFKIDIYEQRFIISFFFEYELFKKTIVNRLTIKKYKQIIVSKVLQTLKDISNYSYLIESSIILCNLESNNINTKYNIIKKIVKNKNTKYNYCFLFDNIEYFNDDINKLNNYASFINIILEDHLNTKSYY